MSIPKLSTFNAFKNCNREIQDNMQLFAGNTLDLLVATVLHQGFQKDPHSPQLLPTIVERFQELTGDSDGWKPNNRAINTSIRRLAGRALAVDRPSSEARQAVRPDSHGLVCAAGYAAIVCDTWRRNKQAIPQLMLGPVSSHGARIRFGTLSMLSEFDRPLTTKEIYTKFRQTALQFNHSISSFEEHGVVDVTPGERRGSPRSLVLTEAFQEPAKELIFGVTSLSTAEGLEHAHQLGGDLLQDNKAFSALLDFSEPHYGRAAGSNS